MFYFPKMCYCFPELLFGFREVLSYIYQECFFSWLNLLFPLRAVQRDSICLALILFPLEAIYWVIHDAFLITLKTRSKYVLCMYNFYLFYSDFSLYDSLERAVSEHLVWLKFQNKASPDRQDYSTPHQTASSIVHCLWQYKNKVPLNLKYSALFNVSALKESKYQSSTLSICNTLNVILLENLESEVIQKDNYIFLNLCTRRRIMAKWNNL